MHVLVALLLAAPPPDLAAQGKPGLDAIRPEALSAHVRFLADDLLEGRGTGSRGHAIAALYFATELQALGFAPAGEDGGYFQKVPLVGMTVQPADSTLQLGSATLRAPQDTVLFPRAGAALDDVRGPLVFAGYGVTAPEYGYDDVPRDLHGKIAVVLFGAPRGDDEFFPTAASAVYSDSYAKARRLKERGALAMIMVITPELSRHYPWHFMERQAPFEQMSWRKDRQGEGYELPAARVPPERLAQLLASSGHGAGEIFAAGAAGKLRPFDLRMEGRLRIAAQVRSFTSDNVVAVLKGGARASELVALTAHLDHLGIGPPIGGDAIYNGAGDNASGVSGVLEMARAFAALPARPPRSILVVGVTGEEKGLQGSDYFARHPTVPIESIVADVNLDMVGWAWQPHDLHALGAEHSSLMADALAAARPLHLAITPDPEPEQVFFIRSDQYSFVRQGIPAVFPSVGFEDASGGVEKGRQRSDWWTKNRYHQPSDEWDPGADYEAMATEVRADFLLALAVALDPDRPRWNPGDVFGKLFTRR